MGGHGPSFGWKTWDGQNHFFQPRLIEKGPYSYDPKATDLFVDSRASAFFPERNTWLTGIQRALKAIDQKQFEKVVLARCEKFCCPTKIDPFNLIAPATAPGRYTFLVQPKADLAFIGSSPECLYVRKSRKILCDALAGTRLYEQQEELLKSLKDQRECLVVKDEILKSLSPLCKNNPTASSLCIKRSDRLCHLYSSIEAELFEHVSDEDLLTALHPTPAVGGHPRKEALAFLSSCEPFARGLYAAPIGWKSEEKAEFAVGIRSCLIRGSDAYLFAGAGILEGSNPEAEWLETEQKLSFWKSILANTISSSSGGSWGRENQSEESFWKSLGSGTKQKGSHRRETSSNLC